jgi:fucose permease
VISSLDVGRKILLLLASRVAPNRKNQTMSGPDSGGRLKWQLSIAYMLSIGCCGIVLVAIGSTFEDLAHNVKRSTTELGTVFIARGCGSIIGTVSSSKLFCWFSGNYVMSGSLSVIMLMLMAIPLSTNAIQLHVYFLFLGLGTSVTDTGCQLLTRKLHGKESGPWLGINATVFGLSAALVPFLELLTSNVLHRYAIFATIVALSFFNMLRIARLNDIEEHKDRVLSRAIKARSKEDTSSLDTVKPNVPHFRTEILVALMLFAFVGGGVSCTAYLETYVEVSGVIERSNKDKIFLALWLSITVGRFVGVYLQSFLGDSGVILSISIFSLGGFLGMLLIYLFPFSPTSLWIGVIVYGFLHGPTVGFCQDLNNRLTVLNESSMSIVMFGLVCGASLIPFLTGFLWKHTGSPMTFVAIVGLSMLIPFPLLHIAKNVSYVYDPHSASDDLDRGRERGRETEVQPSGPYKYHSIDAHTHADAHSRSGTCSDSHNHSHSHSRSEDMHGCHDSEAAVIQIPTS